MSADNGRRRNGRNKNNSGGGGNNNQRQNAQQQKKGGGSKRKSRSRSRSKRVDPAKYWGDRDLLVIPEAFETTTADTSVVATSLGRPPIPGQENASKHYFSLVYDRAAMLAGALAAAGDIDNMRANADALEAELADAADDEDTDDDDDELDDVLDDALNGDDALNNDADERDEDDNNGDDAGGEGAAGD